MSMTEVDAGATSQTSHTYQVSATWFRGLLNGLRSVGVDMERLDSQLTADQREMLHRSYTRPWWNGRLAEGVLAQATGLQGRDTIAEATYRCMVEVVGPLSTPLIRVVGAFFGLSPPTLFSRMADFSSASVKGVAHTWTLAAPRRGTLTLSLTEPVDPLTMDVVWRSVVRYSFELCNAKSWTCEVSSESNTSRYALTW